VRAFSFAMVCFTLLFILNNILIFWFQWPGALAMVGQLGIAGFDAPNQPIEGGDYFLAGLQVLGYLLAVVLPIGYALKYSHRELRVDAALLGEVAAFIIRAAFWGVVMIGIVDAVISFLRVENFLSMFVGEQLTKDLGRSVFRGSWVHYPLLVLALVLAWFVRSLGFIWLCLLVVLAEFSIVITRFVFSYEQAFMGDLVRFWYAALFLFASAYALVNEGHVRVDVIYAHFGKHRKALVNLFGSLTLGIPLCWIILTMGMWKKTSSLNSPMVSFEISQSGYGLYVKYLMAGFMIVFAVSMIAQFCSYILGSLADLRDEAGAGEDRPATL
jgi:TRAP-type mannitol/chloroaromatic compound transport system permease small subunit